MLSVSFNNSNDDNSGDDIDLMMMRLAQSNRPAAGDSWEDRISRRLQRITDALNKEIHTGLEYGRLHKTLSSLENEMLSRKDTGMTWCNSVF